MTVDRNLDYPLWFYRLLRQVRLARGKVWIHDHPEAFQQEMLGVASLLAGRADAELTHG
jgi:hypothetical protein